MAAGAAIISLAAKAAVAGGFISAGVGAAIAIGASLISYAFAPKPKVPALPNFSQEARDRTRQIRQPVTPWDIVYGEVRKSGPVTFLETTNSANQLHMVITLASHPCDSWKAIYINDEPIYPSQLDGDGVVTSGKYANKAKFQVDLGTTGQPFSDLVSDTTNWTSDHNQSGRTKLYVRLTFDRDLYPSGIPNISVRLRGKTVTDTRTSTTLWHPNAVLCLRDYLVTDTDNGGVGVLAADVDGTTSNSGANSCDEFVSTKTWTHTVDTVDTTDNYLDLTDIVTDPDANDIDDGLLHFWTGDRVEVASTGSVPGGLSASTSYYVIVVHERSNDTVKTRIQLASNYDNALSDTAISLTDVGGGTITVYKTGEPRYTINGVVDTSKQPHETIRDMATSMAGYVVNVGGEWQFTPGVWRSSSATFDEDTIRGAISWQTKRPRRELFNAVQGTYVSPHQYDQPTDYSPVTSSTYETEDDGKTNFQQVDMPFVNRDSTCQRIARVILNRHRRQITAKLPLMLHGLQVKASDVISIDNTRAGWSGKTFEVTSWDLGTEDQGGAPLIGVDIGIDEIDANVFAWDPNTDEVATEPAPTTIFRSPTDVTAPGEPTVTEQLYITTNASGVKAKAVVSWAESDDPFVEQYQVEYKLSSASSWTVEPRTEVTSIEILDITPGVYDFRVKAINGLGVSSSYAANTNINVSGLLAAPNDLTGLTLSSIGGSAILRWDQSTDLDVLIGGKVQFRHNKNLSGATWQTSVSIGEAVAGSETVAVLPLKEGTYLARFYDSSSIPSDNATNIVSTAGTALAFANVTSVSEHPTFSGTLTNCYVDGTDLELAGSDNIDDWGLVDDIADWDYEGGVSSTGTYDFASGIDLTTKKRVRLSTTIDATVVNDLDNIDSRTANIDTWEDFDGNQGGDADVQIWVRETDDDPSATPVWSEWNRLDSAEYYARAFDFQARLSSGDPAYNIHISEITVSVDEVV